MAQEQHINMFNKGWTSDVNIILQPDGTYRYMKNCQLISQDGNNYAVKDCLGNVLKFTINTPYATYSAGPPAAFTYAPYSTPIGFISFPDQLVVFSTNNESVDANGNPIGGYLEIGLINYKPYREGIQPVSVTGNYHDGYVPLYHCIDLKGSKLQQIEGFGYEENALLKRVYWTDNFNQPRVFNIADPIFTTYYASGSLSATAGTQYMITEGAITYNGTNYGPGLPAGNVFTTTGGIIVYTNLSGTTPTPKVIKYYPFQLLNFTPDRAMGNIKFNSYGTGSKNCGAKMYFYRLVDSANGSKTSWSYGSGLINVETVNSIASSPNNPYFDLTGAGTVSALVNSGKSVYITIDNIDTNFDIIEVACAEFDQSINVPRLISEVISTPITGTTMTLQDTGSVNLATLSLSDITLFPASILRCKTMTTDKNYNLIGNISERQEFAFDTSAITATEIRSKFPVHKYDPTLCSNVITYTNVSPTAGVNPAIIVEGCNYVVTTGPTTYNAVVYNTGEVFVGIAAQTGFVGGQVRPCVSINKYTAINGGAPTARPNYIELKNPSAFWSYRDPAVAQLKKGYWANEKYRFGILFYDKKGNPMYVRWITDFTFSTCNVNNITERVTGALGAYDYWYLAQRAIKFSNISIPDTIIDLISGFSIVRAERDKNIITEGFLMQVGEGLVPNLIKPIAGPNPKTNSDWLNSKSLYQTLICPDSLTGQVGVAQGLNNSGAYVQEAFWTTPQDYTGTGRYMKSVNDYRQIESRYIGQAATNGTVRHIKINNITPVSELGTITNFGSSGNITFINETQHNVAAYADVDSSCSGLGNTSISNGRSVGGNRLLLELAATMPDLSNNDYGNLATSRIEKIVVDVVVDNVNQYGGSSDAAKANTLYISTGHFQPITAAVKADTYNGSNAYIFNDVEVWGGDCYTCLVDYGHGLFNFTYTLTVDSNSWGLKIPMQCNVNYDLRNGRTIANNMMYPNLTAGTGVVWQDAVGGLRLESFQYNFGYSSDGSTFNYPALPLNFVNNGNFKFRIRFAGVKFPGETIDSFRTFFVNDYKDIDGQGGPINNIRTKDGRVIVWQNAITSTVPVLERQLLSGLSGAATTLGTGGVVDRYDPISSYFGNQHQQGLTQTEYGFAWFDMRKKAFVIMDIGAGIIEVSKIDGLKGFFDEAFLEAEINDAPSTNAFLNSPTFADSSSRPLMGVGITGVYDPKFKMTYLTFKFKGVKSALDGLGVEYFKYQNKDFTVGYYHPDRMFIGVFDWTPSIAWNHNQIVLSANNQKNKTTKWFGASMPSTDFAIGDVVPWNNAEYIVISPVTIPSYPPVGNKVPDYVGSTYFLKINDTSQIWVHNQEISTSSTEYQYNKFFGQVVDNEIQFVVNPKTANPFSALYYEAKGNNVNFTDITITNGVQSASDLNIGSWNRFFRFIYDRWTASFPLSSTGRITDSFLNVRLVKKNWTANPTVLSTGVKVLQYFKTFFEQKR